MGARARAGASQVRPGSSTTGPPRPGSPSDRRGFPMPADGHTEPLPPSSPAGSQSWVLAALQRGDWCWGVEFNHFLETHRKNRKKENRRLPQHRVTLPWTRETFALHCGERANGPSVRMDAGNLRPPLLGREQAVRVPEQYRKPSPSTTEEARARTSKRTREPFALHYFRERDYRAPTQRGNRAD